MPVNFDDQPLGLPRRRAGVVVIGSEGEIPVTIHRRHGHHKRVDMNVLCEEADRLTERVWHIVHDLAIAVLLCPLDELSLGLLHEHAIGLDAAHQLVTQKRPLHVLFRVHVVDLHIVDRSSFGPNRECFHQRRWLAHRLAYGDDAVASDVRDSAMAIGKLRFVLVFVSHQFFLLGNAQGTSSSRQPLASGLVCKSAWCARSSLPPHLPDLRPEWRRSRYLAWAGSSTRVWTRRRIPRRACPLRRLDGALSPCPSQGWQRPSR